MDVTPHPGLLVFAHSDSIIGRAIRFGERLRGRTGDAWNHVAVVDHQLPTGDWQVVEAEPAGVVVGKLSAVAGVGGRYELVALPAGCEPSRCVAFARSQLGQSYGWLSILSIVVGILTPKWFHLPSIRARKSWICSALGAEAARFAGWLCDWPDIYDVMPSELYAALMRTSPHRPKP